MMKISTLKMKKISKNILIGLILLFPLFVNAISLPGKDSDVGTYISFIFKFALGACAATAMGILVYGGFVYIISGGNQNMIGTAKEYIFGALAGLLLLAGAYLLLKTINPDLIETDFDIAILQDVPEDPNGSTSYPPPPPPLPEEPIPGKSVSEEEAQAKADELSEKLTYKYGGDPFSDETDCSGAAQRMRIELGGTNPGRSSLMQLAEAKASGNFSMDLGNLQPGDIIIRTSYSGGYHVGTYIGNGMVWNSTSGGFRSEPLGNFMSRGQLLGINKFH